MRKAIAWALFWMGDKVSRVIFNGEFSAQLGYRVYNKLMLSSYRVQGDGAGPWMAPE